MGMDWYLWQELFLKLSGLLNEGTSRLFSGSWRQNRHHQEWMSVQYNDVLSKVMLPTQQLKALLFDMFQNGAFKVHSYEILLCH